MSKYINCTLVYITIMLKCFKVGETMDFRESFTLKSNELKESKVFRDAIHGYIHVEHMIIWQLINSEQMQRLRRIKQLGGTFQVFPTAEHSRFTHSLGVYEIVRKMLDTECLKDSLSDYDKLCVMIAGLLHDIGHGPFSHSFEHVYNENHEYITIRMILEDSDVHHILSSLYYQLPHDVASIINKTHNNPILIQMISSQLDADRMDYLLRDSYMTGTTYGQFDMSRILRTMRLYNGRIVFKKSGVQAIENYILARYHMYWQVYLHPTSRSYEQLLISIFTRMRDLYKKGYKFKTDMKYLMPFLNNEMSIKEYCCLDEMVIEYYFREFTLEDDDILSDLCDRFLNRKLLKYKELKDNKEYEKIQSISDNKGFNSRYYVFSDSQTKVPYHYHGMSGNLNEIEILTNEGLLPLPEVSEIVEAIVYSKKHKEDHKVFFPKEIKNEL